MALTGRPSSLRVFVRSALERLDAQREHEVTNQVPATSVAATSESAVRCPPATAPQGPSLPFSADHRIR
jgi:hypothetical protein